MEQFLQGNISFMSWWRSAFKDVNEYAHSNMIENKIILSLLFIKLACLVQFLISTISQDSFYLVIYIFIHAKKYQPFSLHWQNWYHKNCFSIHRIFFQKILKIEQIVYTSIFIWLLHECQLEEKNVSKRLMKDHKMAKK